jgi:hypothetical protein
MLSVFVLFSGTDDDQAQTDQPAVISLIPAASQLFRLCLTTRSPDRTTLLMSRQHG